MSIRTYCNDTSIYHDVIQFNYVSIQYHRLIRISRYGDTYYRYIVASLRHRSKASKTFLSSAINYLLPYVLIAEINLCYVCM